MTDKLPPLVTQIVPPSQPLFTVPTVAPVQNDAPRQETVEEEPYTIKCICNFSGDDGNTIYCETCDTWQHIECYYPDNKDPASLEDFAHSCVECNPRILDRRQAIERQHARAPVVPLREEEMADKKVKRPPSKSHKKKPKPTDLQVNVHSTGMDGSKHASPHDHPPPAKKSKNSHKASQSISSQAPVPKRSPSYGNARAGQGHPPSPATTPPDLPEDLEIHAYSSGFLSLCRDPTVTIVHINSFVSLPVSNTMSDWLRNPEKMQRETGCRHSDVFHKLPSNLDATKRPVEIRQMKKTVAGNIVQWQCLKASSPIDKYIPLVELNGEVGFQASYCANVENRWEEFSAPLPFVLFHPMLPLYIDTRREGSEARYVRRSCRPNAQLETFLSDGREYHFWLVSDRQIPIDEEITIPWDFRLKPDGPRWLRLLGLSDEDTSLPEPNIDEAEYTRISVWVHLVLSEHGGCACGQGNECAFAKFHRNYHGKLATKTNQPKKKVRKPKAQHTLSPTSTGQATNSRAPSEGHLDDVPEHQDGRSVSGSSRSKPPSRDMTPVARQGSFDTLGILTEPTDRDKRKVAMVEDSFRRMEQQQPPRKKKRTSEGPVAASSSSSKPKTAVTAVQTPNLSNGSSERHYVDAGTSRSKSGSPAHTLPPNFSQVLKDLRLQRAESVSGASRTQSDVPGNPSYCDAGVQTDPEERSWYEGVVSHTPTPTPKRRVVSLSKRLLNNRHHKKRESGGHEEYHQTLVAKESSTAMDIDSPSESKSARSPSLGRDGDRGSAATSPGAHVSHDIDMHDAPSPKASSQTLSQTLSPPPASASAKIPSPELRVQLPPVPAFSNSGSAMSPATTPLSIGGPFAQSPLSAIGVQTSFPPGFDGITINPSPVKKKWSLSDYTRKRAEGKAGGKPSAGSTGLRPPNSEEPRSASSAENSIFSDSPVAERTPTSDASVSPAAASTKTAQA